MSLHWEIEFDQAGGLLTDGGLSATLARGGPSDLFVFCPGWHTGRDSARELSAAMFGLIAVVNSGIGIRQELKAPVKDVVAVQPGTLPRTSSGKLRRATVRAWYVDGNIDRCH